MNSESSVGPWYCDTCGRIIERPQDGWVESKFDDNGIHSGLRLVHSATAGPRKHLPGPGCRYDGGPISDASLEDYLGPEGLNDLLNDLEKGTHPLQEIVDMIRRLHLPEYEVGRRYIDEAISAGAFVPNTAPGTYSLYHIQLAAQWAREHGKA